MAIQRSILVTAVLMVLVPVVSLLQPQASSEPPAKPLALSESAVSPDEPLAVTLGDRFAPQNALDRLEQVRAALVSFRRLTRVSRSEAIAPVGNTDPETQTLGFTNWTGDIEGTLRQQAYQISKLEYELAQERHADGEISAAELAQAAERYRQEEERFRAFLAQAKVVD